MPKERNRKEQRAARRLMKTEGLKYTEALRQIRADPDNDPIYISHEQDSSLDDDEMILHSMIDPNSIKKDNE